MSVTIDEWAAEVVRAQSISERMMRRLTGLTRMGKRMGFTADEMKAAVNRQMKVWASEHAAEVAEILKHHYAETGERPRDPSDGRAIAKLRPRLSQRVRMRRM